MAAWPLLWLDGFLNIETKERITLTLPPPHGEDTCPSEGDRSEKFTQDSHVQISAAHLCAEGFFNN